MTIQLTVEQEKQLTHLASNSEQSLGLLVSEILTAYLDRHNELLAELTEARADLAAGRVLTSEQVWEQVQKRFAVS